MAIVDLILPKLGESIMEATILKWMKNVGDPVKMDESILEIATDKVDSEVPSTAEGTLYEILYNVNDVVPVDSVIARIKTAGGDDAVVLPTQKEEPENLNEEHFEVVSTEIKKPEPSLGNGNARFYSPLVLNIAASEGIGMSELEQIPGTGKEGRVTKNDILEYAAKRGKTFLFLLNFLHHRSLKNRFLFKPRITKSPLIPATWKLLKWIVCES